MDDCTKDYLRENILSLYRSWQAQEAPGDDDRMSLHTAYQILNVISTSSGDAEMIGRCIGRSAHTVFEYLGVMEAEGIPIVRTGLKGKPGRPTTIFSLEIES
jgi:hypothetical protein